MTGRRYSQGSRRLNLMVKTIMKFAGVNVDPKLGLADLIRGLERGP